MIRGSAYLKFQTSSNINEDIIQCWQGQTLNLTVSFRNPFCTLPHLSKTTIFLSKLALDKIQVYIRFVVRVKLN